MNNNIVKLILPEKFEMIVYAGLASLLLLLSNISRLWNYLSGGVGFNEVSKIDNYSVLFQTQMLNLESKIDPRVADFSVWLVVGVVAVVILMATQGAIDSGAEEIKETSRIASKANRQKKRMVYITRLALRFAGAVLLFVWFRAFFGAVFPEMSLLFFGQAVDLMSLHAWVSILISIIVTALGLYIFAVCIRFMVLKIRVFN